MRKLLIPMVALALASCVTPVDPMVASDEDDATCMRWGFYMDTPEYGRCRMVLAEQRTTLSRERAAQIRAGILAAAQTPQREPARSSVVESHRVQPIRTTCFAKGERSSGMNKICFYDCLGSAHAETIGVAELCPLTVSR